MYSNFSLSFTCSSFPKCGAGFSGAILTWIMCENMGRNILSVIFGGAGTANPTASPSGATIEGEITTATVDLMCEALIEAKNVIIVPGYGLAVAQAQFAVAEIVKVLRERYGKNVRFG
jgi:NAD/NADP transhydrogenase beta subunit